LPTESGMMGITPQIALDWLKRNPKNRPLRFRQIRKYMEELTTGHWVFNGQSISFKKNGDLNDGQHRLWACVLAKRNFTSMVVIDVDNNAFPTVDTGLRRLASDVLAIEGVKYQTWVAGAARYALLWAKSPRKRVAESWDKGQVFNEDVLSFVMDHPDLEDLAGKFQKLKLVDVIRPGLGIFCWAEMRAMNKRKADDFMEAFATGVGLDRGSPILTLREELRREFKRLRPVEVIARVVKAWNAYYYGKKLTRFMFRADGWAPNFGDEDELREIEAPPPPPKAELRKTRKVSVVEETIAE
jgi:hypothetical protein